MDLTPHSGIIVDSSFSSRKKLTQDLRDSKLVQNIYEAKSVADALQRLASEETDICFIGPTVSVSTAISFATSIKTTRLQAPCALIAVVSERNEDEATLLKAKDEWCFAPAV
jgi:two-component SAPR family response regulator